MGQVFDEVQLRQDAEDGLIVIDDQGDFTSFEDLRQYVGVGVGSDGGDAALHDLDDTVIGGGVTADQVVENIGFGKDAGQFSAVDHRHLRDPAPLEDGDGIGQ